MLVVVVTRSVHAGQALNRGSYLFLWKTPSSATPDPRCPHGAYGEVHIMAGYLHEVYGFPSVHSIKLALKQGKRDSVGRILSLLVLQRPTNPN
jgi:hypothetical protein